MTEPSRTGAGARPMSAGASANAQRPEPANLADILERVLDKGIVIAGDIQVNLLDIELLTIKIRLVVSSVERAREMGIDWWEHDPGLSSAASRSGSDSELTGSAARSEVPDSDERKDLANENRRLRERIEALEAGQRGVAPEPEPEQRGGEDHG